MANFTLGLNAKLYRAAALFDGTTDAVVDAATLTEMTNVRDLSISGSTGEADVTTRGANAWRQTASTLRELEMTFEMVHDEADADYLAIIDAWLHNSEIAMVALNDSTGANSDGPASNWVVTQVDRDESLEEALKVSITVKASSDTQWYGAGTS